MKVGFTQTNRSDTLPPMFTVKVRVVDEATNEPIRNATVSVNGVVFSFSHINDRYLVRARAGDELVVTHPDFENVYYTIKDDEDIKVKVEDFVNKRRSSKKLRKKPTKKRLKSELPSKYEEAKVDRYNTLLDSAKYYKEKSIDKSLSFIQGILLTKESRNRNAATYTTLANIYMFWKQYDLAITNYINALNFNQNSSVQILLGQAYLVSKNFKQAESTFNRIVQKGLIKYEQILRLEGLGDAYLGLKRYKKSKENYQRGLQIAIANNINAKITDLNSKLGDVFAAEGNLIQAKKSFTNSINSAKTENLNKSLKVQDKVANFFNENSQFDDEIQLRKESLKDIKNKDSITTVEALEKPNVDNDGFFDTNTPEGLKDGVTTTFSGKKIVTPQSLNYKIGRAYTQKAEYQKAIPYLQKSINVPEMKDNLEVKKDATRKLSETYAAVGEFDKALKSYQDYVDLVDKTYIEKEQEIAQAKRFAKKIADNQNRIASLEKDRDLKNTKIDLATKDQELSEERNRNQLTLIYSLLVGLLALFMVAYLLFRSNRQQKLANNLLALKSMRSQMNPHFIFNALNSVNSFIAVNDERNANRYLSEFSVLMRSVLENSDEDFIPLAKEIELLELYVKLEHNRFKDKFEYVIEVNKEIEIEQFSIPPMLLQPYIENAIWHGLRYKKEMGLLKISIQPKDTDAVIICIEDDGVGRKKSMELKTKNQLKQKSKGMSTIQNRIAILNDMYQDRISVEVTDMFANGEGTKVKLLLRKN
jgi:tetratricopeptide (TPR) repeat protein